MWCLVDILSGSESIFSTRYQDQDPPDTLKAFFQYFTKIFKCIQYQDQIGIEVLRTIQYQNQAGMKVL
jgi:hypothetical protein